MQYNTASLDGKQWQHPDAVYAALAMIPSLPLIDKCVRYTFEGALETWERFTADKRNHQRLGLTRQQKTDHLLMPTNDHNEGGAGTVKRAKQRAPNASMDFIDSKARWTRNHPKQWVKDKAKENPDLFKYVGGVVRQNDASGEVQRKRKAIAAEAEEIAQAHTQKRAKTKARKDQKQSEVNNCVPIEDTRLLTDPERLKTLCIVDLDIQIDWYRAQEKVILDKFETKAHSTLKTKGAKAAAIVSAIKRRQDLVTSGHITRFYRPPEATSNEEETDVELEVEEADDADIVGFGG